MKELAAILDRLLEPRADHPHVLATLVSVEGSSYRRPGARLLIPHSGPTAGSISGGCLEEDVLAHAVTVAASGQPRLVVYDTTTENELAWGVGLGCHGVVRVFIEKLPPRPTWAETLATNLREGRDTQLAILAPTQPDRPLQMAGGEAVSGTVLATHLPAPTPEPPLFTQTILAPQPLVVFGAGNDAIPLVHLAKDLGWHVTVADPRSAYLTKERFSQADVLVLGPADQLVSRLNLTPRTLAVVMTHHYVHDVPIIGALLPHSLAYLGLLGPRKRAMKILSDLSISNPEMDSSQLDRIHAPVGLDLGAETPSEVALSIIAEMLAVVAGRDGRPLRDRRRPIHA